MSGSLVGRVIRPMVLLVVGTIIAQTTVSIAAAPAPASGSTQTRSASCQAMNFHPIDRVTGFRIDGGTLLYRWETTTNTETNAGSFVCDPQLPHRAVVTKVQFTLKDDSENARLQYCGLFRSSLRAGSAGTYQALAQVSTTGMTERPGIVRQSDSIITHATVDTTDWAYWLQCRIEFLGFLIGTGDVGIYGAEVTYTISSANG